MAEIKESERRHIIDDRKFTDFRAIEFHSGTSFTIKKRIARRFEKEGHSVQIVNNTLKVRNNPGNSKIETQEFVSQHIRHHRAEGKPQDQAIAIALSEARAKGHRVPPPPKDNPGFDLFGWLMEMFG